MEKVVFYCRTSTSEQEEQKTIETQIEVLEKKYKERNVVNVYRDEGHSGAYLQRPALKQLREDAKSGKFNVLGLYALDRLSRKTGHQLFLQDEFKKDGIKIEIQGEPFKDTAEGNFSNTILSAVAELEREKIKQRMWDGIYRRIDNGVLIGCLAPYGYNTIKRDKHKRTEARFEIDPAKAEVVKKIFQVFINEQNVRQTARKITELGIYGKPIQPRRIAHIIRDKTYIGTFHFNKTITEVKENEKTGEIKTLIRQRPKKEWKPIEVPAIIDKATFERANEIINERTKNYITEKKYKYLLSGLIRCSHCGRLYGGQPTQYYKDKIYFNYICHKKHNRPEGAEPCPSRSISLLRAEKYIWDYVKSLINKPDEVKKSIRKNEKEREDRRVDNQNLYDILMGQKYNIKTEKSKLLKLYAKDEYSEEDLDKEIGELNGIEKGLDEQIEEVKGKLKKIDEINQLEKEVEKLCLLYQKEGFKNPSFETKRLIIRSWIKEINITDEGDIKLKVRVPVFEGVPFKIPNTNTISSGKVCPMVWARKLAENHSVPEV